MTVMETLESPVATSARPLDSEEILARAQALAPEFRLRSDEIERERRLPADVVELLRGTGVFRMAMPKSLGGPELTFSQQTRVIEALSIGDSAVGWCGMIGMDTWAYARCMPESVERSIIDTPDLITAGMIFPSGKAERVPGGYRVSGRWSFGSGITHCDWLIGGVLVHQDGEPEADPDGGAVHWRVIMGRPEQFEILDTWYTTGLAGSGSRDYQVTDLFVPEEHTFRFGHSRGEGPLTARDAFLGNVSGVPLGVARAVLDHVRELAGHKVERVTSLPWSDSYRVQLAIAQAEMDLTVARDAVYASLDRQWDRLAEGRAATKDEQVSAAVARVNAFRTARSIAIRMSDMVGTASIYRTSPLERWTRDLHTMCQHILAQDQVLQSAGALLLGSTPLAPFPLGVKG
ncbi:acyl-CoA dehydrogenase family protein [Kitasatospora sp. MAP5-34]|uniref:acyl-CoA dehydrogenase family protein n=1 Tax=Kitasatospora sp. MAP5-34 TaxID=3035102 RepID=UPI0024735A24|nr:acyl-CoA dehydrogenase family protein [Kitasatospora sp. MAP5-34]MDH6580002.1 alkylation response protein AidB-like acyl-CoA dehydrogenase [Kitasatospora sp. MAP5-34]